MKKQVKQRPAGELRQSQVVTTFGPGAMVDLPDHAVVIGGLDHWYGDRRRIHEERLEWHVARLLELPDVALYAPPVDEDAPSGKQTGIAAFQFPRWFLAQMDAVWDTPDGRRYRTRPLVPAERLTRGGWLNDDKRVVKVVPVRFVQACRKGHLSDVDWYAFVRRTFRHDGQGLLWLDEGGAGNDFSDIFVRDERTGERRPLSDARVPTGEVLGTCRGRQPWLGERASSPCDEKNRLLNRTASNAYFPQRMAAISIPDAAQALREAVDGVWEAYLKNCRDRAQLEMVRSWEPVANALAGLSGDAVWAEVERRRQGGGEPPRGLKQVEMETFLADADRLGVDAEDSVFSAEVRPLAGLPGWLRDKVRRIVLIHRLREVIAQVGFTRLEPSLPDISGELSLGVELAPLAEETTWVPAVENRGEGVFIGFATEAIDGWLKEPGVEARAAALEAGYRGWTGRRGQADAVHPGIAYVLLHSLSHLLITAVSLECGYAASAIKERIYAGPFGYGILLYTGSSGSEGTLGGLVEVGRRLEQHVARALELGRLCGNDPVCAQHDPQNTLEERFLHGAACHGCLLIAETCCELRNEHLDRALVVPTVETPDAAFFRGVVA